MTVPIPAVSDALSQQPPEPYRVLVVDDDALLLQAQGAVLQRAGMAVRTLSEPLRFLGAVEEFAPEVVVLDVYMADANGLELAAALRERSQHIPILFLSSETDTALQLQALGLGGDDFLVKPVSPNHLVAAVTARVRRARESLAVQQRLENALYEREREHLALNHHAIVSIADLAGNITYVNQKFCEVSGYARDELIGKNHRILKSNEHSPEFYRNLWHTIAGGQVWQGEICNRRQDGSVYWVASTITPFLGSDDKATCYEDLQRHFRGESETYFNEHRMRCKDGSYKWILDRGMVVERQVDGSPLRVIGTHSDITQRKRAELALAERERQLREAQALARLGSWSTDAGTGKMTWSDEVYVIFGYDPNTYSPDLANYYRDIVHPADVLSVQREEQAAYASNRRHHYSAVAHNSSGNFPYDRARHRACTC